jgi:hypothetical protein
MDSTVPRTAACRGGGIANDGRDRAEGTPPHDGRREGGSNHPDGTDDDERSHYDLHGERPGPGSAVTKSERGRPGLKPGSDGVGLPTRRGG